MTAMHCSYMRVAILSYPMLFQRLGGLQVQVRETVGALREMGIDARLFDVTSEKLSEYDVVHVFSAINGVERIVEAAKDVGKPVVLSSVIHASDARAARHRARLASWLTGRITGWEYKTGYDQTRRAIDLADRIVALGEFEAEFVAHHFDQQRDKIRIVPNGIARRFFTADPRAFLEKTGLPQGYLLCAASVSPYKNQLGLVRAAKGLSVPIVLIGPCATEHQAYLAQCRTEAGSQLHYIGPLQYDDPLLASAYAGAGVTVLPSRTEVMPLSILESLAAGTPAVVTRHQSLGLAPQPPLYTEVDPENTAAIRDAIDAAIAVRTSSEQCRSIVAHLDWARVAQMIAAIYRELTEAA
jgi:glycosyltransferase involved in cell wall biosynthesis